MSPTTWADSYALLTRPPLVSTEASFCLLPFDLHVLGMPPAFNLSQDQTLQFKFAVTWGDQSLLDDYCPIIRTLFIEIACLANPRRERPHKLPDLIVKERGRELCPTETGNYTSTPGAVKSNFCAWPGFLRPPIPDRSNREGGIISAL